MNIEVLEKYACHQTPYTLISTYAIDIHKGSKKYICFPGCL